MYDNWSQISLRNLTVEYRQRGLPSVVALRSVSVEEVERGSLVSIEGENGSGKTTLLEVMAGRREASAGEIALDDHPLKSFDLRQRAALAFVPQKPSEGIVSCMTVRENLGIRRSMLSEPARLWKRIDDMVSNSQLRGIRDRYGVEFLTEERLKADPRSLSGGQQQVLTVLSCMLAEPEILLMDEPTSKLSADRRKTVWKIVVDMLEKGVTVFVSSHDNEGRPKELANYRVVLKDGWVEALS